MLTIALNATSNEDEGDYGIEILMEDIQTGMESVFELQLTILPVHEATEEIVSDEEIEQIEIAIEERPNPN